MEPCAEDIAEVDYTETHLNTLMKVTRAISTMTLIKVKLGTACEGACKPECTRDDRRGGVYRPSADTTVDVSAVVTEEDTGSH
jgi:hypothetical protein